MTVLRVRDRVIVRPLRDMPERLKAARGDVLEVTGVLNADNSRPKSLLGVRLSVDGHPVGGENAYYPAGWFRLVDPQRRDVNSFIL